MGYLTCLTACFDFFCFDTLQESMSFLGRWSKVSWCVCAHASVCVCVCVCICVCVYIVISTRTGTRVHTFFGQVVKGQFFRDVCMFLFSYMPARLTLCMHYMCVLKSILIGIYERTYIHFGQVARGASTYLIMYEIRKDSGECCHMQCLCAQVYVCVCVYMSQACIHEHTHKGS